MQYKVADIQEAVRVILDQNQTESIIASEDNTLKLDEIIKQKIVHAARHLLETSDVSAIDYGKTLDGGTLIEIGEVGSLSIYKLPCPSDYLRLLSLQMSDWRRAVHTTIPENAEEYAELKSGFMGITGNPERPAVAECMGRGGDPDDDVRWLEIYSSATGELLAGKNRYCPIPEIKKETVGGVANTEVLYFPERLYRMLLYQTASFVAATYKDTALSQLLMNMVYDGEPEEKPEQ